jgi:hypothetical protein
MTEIRGLKTTDRVRMAEDIDIAIFLGYQIAQRF